MNPLIFVWDSIFYHPIVNLILFIYKYTGNNLGIAIIVLTVVIRIILWPMMRSQIKSMKKMNDLKPHLDALKVKHKDDKRKLQEAQLQLYKEHGINPLGSCLSLIIQLPFLIAVYNVIRTVSVAANQSVFNNIVYAPVLKLSSTVKFNTNFLGVNLAKDAVGVGFNHWPAIIPYLIVALLVGVTQFYASKVSLPSTTTTPALPVVEEKVSNRKKQKSKAVLDTTPRKPPEEPLNMESFNKVFTTQTLYLFPLLLIFFSLGLSGNIPSALSLYWIIQSLFVIIQTLYLQGNLPWIHTQSK